MLGPVLSLLCLSITACIPAEPIRSKFVQRNTSLHQVFIKRTNRTGQLLWELQAAKVEMMTPQVAHLSQIQGTFYQNREALYSFQAPQGKVRQHSNFLQLQGPVVVKNLRDRSTLHSQHIQWHPQSGQLIAKAGVILEHPHFRLQGQRFQASTREHQARLSGQVTVTLPHQGWQLQSPQLTWLPRQRKIQAHSTDNERVMLQPMSGVAKSAIAWQQAEAKRIDFSVLSGQLVLDQSVHIDFIEPTVKLSSSKVIMDPKRERWYSPQGIRIEYQGITTTADQGWFDSSQTLRLQNQILVKGLPHQAYLRAQALTWNVVTQDISAQGQLVYQQPAPWLKLTGARAFGNLHQQTLEVQGGETVAEILP